MQTAPFPPARREDEIKQSSWTLTRLLCQDSAQEKSDPQTGRSGHGSVVWSHGAEVAPGRRHSRARGRDGPAFTGVPELRGTQPHEPQTRPQPAFKMPGGRASEQPLTLQCENGAQGAVTLQEGTGPMPQGSLPAPCAGRSHPGPGFGPQRTPSTAPPLREEAGMCSDIAGAPAERPRAVPAGQHPATCAWGCGRHNGQCPLCAILRGRDTPTTAPICR